MNEINIEQRKLTPADKIYIPTQPQADNLSEMTIHLVLITNNSCTQNKQS